MCLNRIKIAGKTVDNGVIFEGYKLFKIMDGVPHNYNDGKNAYMYNMWHTSNYQNAKEYEGDKRNLENIFGYPAGFHICLTGNDAKTYHGQTTRPDQFDILKVKFKDILAIGEQYGANVVVADKLYIERPISRLSDLKSGDIFKRYGTSQTFRMLKLHDTLKCITKEGSIHHLYIYEGEKDKIVYGDDKNSEITLVK